MNPPTAAVGGTGLIAHVSDLPVYTAPAAHALPIAPAGHVYIAPVLQSSGIGIAVDHHA